ncbi:MAG TPA: ABC transporter ATP-binding protein [Arachnia sp.]|nr:ABC transporter ATP-binding protein [Arachnia sp.]HMT87586.1 ABC transporter ATP-binding protein [Arachnia sp.]
MVEPLIALDGVERRYPGPPEVYALRDATFTIDPGEYVAITGPSGAGKSTLLNILGLLTRPTAGRYVFNGQDVTLLSENQAAGIRARWIGVVFQAFHLLNDRPVVTNVAMGALYGGHDLTDAEIRERAEAAVNQVGLAHRAGAMPSTLSGGERQRVAIARALMMRPRLLLCDEPTGNLDSRTTDEILSVFGELNEAGQTVVMITHSAEVAAHAGRVLQVRDGVVCE